jgi:hypothetical protein
MKRYQFVLLRYCHNWAAGELINIGVIMWVPEDHQLLYFLSQRYERLSSLYQDFDSSSYKIMMRQIDTKLKENYTLTNFPEDSSCFQLSMPMGGITPNPHERLEQLRIELVDNIASLKQGL